MQGTPDIGRGLPATKLSSHYIPTQFIGHKATSMVKFLRLLTCFVPSRDSLVLGLCAVLPHITLGLGT